MSDPYGILMCGVGGQGLVVLSRVLGTACATEGLRAVTGEQHGLSQRSGSVSIHFRIGEGAFSPLIPLGTAEVIAGLEALETLRYVEYLRKGGTVLLSTLVMHPVTETAARIKSPAIPYWDVEKVTERLTAIETRPVPVDCRGIAARSGAAVAENMVLLGALAALPGFPVGRPSIEEAINRVFAGAVEANLEAFRQGTREAVPGF
ncbi:indolepyruvate oxidoreductase subunit beta [Candidatus Fermentibacteria bacterium]|nr:indolepyruvate oxidoreductase subunit beta [Candidatus Fermentibacteria bacterium]